MINKQRALCVVAHPDDEVLWCGGTIAERVDIEWTVLCCSIPRSDPIRAFNFFRACKVLGARGILFPFIETKYDERLPYLPPLEKGYDSIYTHNANGEYGHAHHKQVHRYVTEFYIDCPILCFGVGALTTVHVALSDTAAQKKLQALKCYDHQLPYAGKIMTKCDALLLRYKSDISFLQESFVKFR